MMRIASYRIHQSLVQKPLRLTEYWPLYLDKSHQEAEQKFEQLTQEEYENIKKLHGIN